MLVLIAGLSTWVDVGGITPFVFQSASAATDLELLDGLRCNPVLDCGMGLVSGLIIVAGGHGRHLQWMAEW